MGRQNHRMLPIKPLVKACMEPLAQGVGLNIAKLLHRHLLISPHFSSTIAITEETPNLYNP